MCTCCLSLYTNHSTIRVAFCRCTYTHYIRMVMQEYVAAYPIKWPSGVALKWCNLMTFVAIYKIGWVTNHPCKNIISSPQSWNIPQFPFLLSTDSTDESYIICFSSICTKCLQDKLTQQCMRCILHLFLTSLVILRRGSMWYKVPIFARSPKLPLK